MFINPQHAIKEGWIKGIRNLETQVQPNAIDFTMDRLFCIYEPNQFIICTDKDSGKELKQMRGGAEIQPVDDRRTGVEFFNLESRTSYDVLSDIYVDVPEGVAAITVTRSTFIRNGIFVISGLYDSGFKGHLGVVLHNMSGPARIEKGTRVGQVIFVESQNAHLYKGGWNHDEKTEAPHQTAGLGVSSPA